jgi:hypothetical protein
LDATADLPELLILRSLEFCKFLLQSLGFLAVDSFFFFTSALALLGLGLDWSLSMLAFRFFLQLNINLRK